MGATWTSDLLAHKSAPIAASHDVDVFDELEERGYVVPVSKHSLRPRDAVFRMRWSASLNVVKRDEIARKLWSPYRHENQRFTNIFMPISPERIYHFETKSELESEFSRLADRWRIETGGMSAPQQKIMHESYQQIIGMGPEVLPFIFRELQDRGGHWFWALSAITRHHPVPREHAGNVRLMKETWLLYAREHGYLGSEQ